MAAGIFIKGVSPLFGGLTILGLLIADRKGQWLKGLRCSWGIPLLLILTAAWLIPFSMASGHNFLWDMISGDVLPKLAGGQQSHGMPPGYFTLIFTAAFWPASLFIIPAGIWSWRHRGEPAVRFLLAWIIPAWIFFELVPTKLPEYVLPTYPAIALLIALTLASGVQLRAPRWLQILRIFQQGLWIICTLALTGALIYLGGWGWVSAALVLAAGGYLLYIVIANEFSISSLRAPAKQSSTERCPKYVLDCFAGARNDGFRLRFQAGDRHYHCGGRIHSNMAVSAAGFATVMDQPAAFRLNCSRQTTSRR